MTQIVSNIIQNTLSGFVSGAVTTLGGYAGDAISSVGDFVEQKGDALGKGECLKLRPNTQKLNCCRHCI
jgi:hypothetical protein